MSRKKNQQSRDQMTFQFTVTKDELLTLSGGSQEKLSDFEMELRLCMKTVLDDAGKRALDPLDRIEVAARMSRALGREIQKSHIDQWVALSTVQRRIHVDALKAFCEITQDYRPLHIFVESCGFRMLDKDLALCAEWGASEVLRRSLANKQKSLGAELESPGTIEALAKRVLGEK